jgi:hypothetical protein
MPPPPLPPPQAAITRQPPTVANAARAERTGRGAGAGARVLAVMFDSWRSCRKEIESRRMLGLAHDGTVTGPVSGANARAAPRIGSRRGLEAEQRHGRAAAAITGRDRRSKAAAEALGHSTWYAKNSARFSDHADHGRGDGRERRGEAELAVRRLDQRAARQDEDERRQEGEEGDHHRRQPRLRTARPARAPAAASRRRSRRRPPP